MDIHDIMERVNRLADLERKGWCIRDVKDPESVMDHSFRTALLALVMGKDLGDIDVEHLTALSIIHDLGEHRAGDITPFCGVDKEEKHIREREGYLELFKGDPEMMALWKELEKGKSPESRLVKELDKVDMAFMALHYETKGHDPRSLDEFWGDAKSKVRHPVLIKALDDMEKKRK